MPPKAIMRMEKRKGGAITLSDRHNNRTQPVLNADPERTRLNRTLYGPDRPTREIVTEVINEHGGKPRKDSVEAIEFLCKASPEFFNEKDPQKFQEKVDAFIEQAMQFLQDERSGGILVKAVLHMDERTLHIHAYKVPINPEGKLNNKHYMRDREQMERNQDLYHEYMKPLGLEWGERRSRATHVRIEDFYKSIEAPVRLEVDHDEIPDPPKVLITEKERRKYKDKVTRAVLKQLEEAHKTMRDQAMLAQHEKGQREEAERKAEERVQAAELAAKERVAEVERLADDRFKNLLRSAEQLLDENRGLRRENHDLLTERNDLHESVIKLGLEKQGVELEAKEYRERLTDIPMPEVMQRMGYKGERQGEAHIYRDAQGRSHSASSSRRCSTARTGSSAATRSLSSSTCASTTRASRASLTTTPSNGSATSSASSAPGARPSFTASTPRWISSSGSVRSGSALSSTRAATTRGAGLRAGQRTTIAARAAAVTTTEAAAGAPTSAGRPASEASRIIAQRKVRRRGRTLARCI